MRYKKMKQKEVKKTVEEKKKPLAKFKAGKISATVWDREVEKKDSKDVYTIYNVEIVKNYTIDDGKTWKKTNNFGKEDLVRVEIVTRKALEFLMLNDDEE
jgi:hypothetical protein